MMSNRQAIPSRSLPPPGKQRWHKSAPEAIRRAARNGEPLSDWRLWIEHLATRGTPIPLVRLWGGGNALLWAAGTDGNSDASKTGPETAPAASHGQDAQSPPAGESTLDLLRRLPLTIDGEDGFWRQEAAGWLADPRDACPGARRALEALGWASALAAAADGFGWDLWWRLLDHLVGLAEDAAGLSLDRDPLVHQLLGGELALTLGYLFPELSACRPLAKTGRGSLTEGLLELVDGGGLPDARVLGVFRPLLACWTRCHLIGEQLENGCASNRAQLQYAWAIRAALRLSRPDGSGVFALANGRCDDRGLFDAALRCGGDGDDERIAAIALPGRKAPEHSGEGELPAAADHSGWAAVTVLRPGWRRGEPRLVVAYPERQFRLELSQQKELLLAGNWDTLVRVDGEPLQPVGSWEELCWVTDGDIDYLELGIALSGGARLQRHAALAREDQFLFLADAVIDCPGTTIEYRGRLPFAAGAGFGQAAESWEGFLLKDRAAALVLPLGLPEWRAEGGPGSLRTAGSALELCHRGRGGAILAPLFIDLKPRRMTRGSTWRRLTVAENQSTQPPEVAVGYRVASGNDQWLVYRSLAPAANRTVLGHNLITELLIARFGRDGQVQSLIEIEG